MKSTKKICYVVCYKDPNYIRTQTLTAALRLIPNVELLEVRNTHRGLLRYLEVPLKLVWARLKYRPSLFIVGFRAQECFWLLYPAMLGKPKILDEFINLHDYLVSEHQKFKENSLPIRMLDGYMRWVIGRCRLVLTDTAAHARLSSKIYGIELDRFVPVPVGTDEAMFKPQAKRPSSKFQILFYGTMLPLHGMDVILDSIITLKNSDQLDGIEFTLVGGRGKPAMQKKLDDFIQANKLADNVKTIPWINYADLPKKIAEVDLCLGGPFGDTGQAGRVVTGKTYQFLAMAKPTVIGRIDGATEFKDKRNCLLVERGNPESLAKAVAWAATHGKELNSIGEAGRKLYKEKFSLDRISETLSRII